MKVAEQTTGKRFEVTYEPIEAAIKKANNDEDGFSGFLLLVQCAIASGDFSLRKIPPNLNSELKVHDLLPKLWTLEEYIQARWST